MDAIVEKFVAAPKKEQSNDELILIQQSIDATLQQLSAVESDKDKFIFTNEAKAVELKKRQLQMLQKRKESVEMNDRVADKKFRKIDLSFLKRTKRRQVEGRLGGSRVTISLKTPLYSFHRLCKYSGEYSFTDCEMRIDFLGGKYTYFDIQTMSSGNIIHQILSNGYKKRTPLNFIRYWSAAIRDRDVRVSLKDSFSGLIPTEVKEEAVEALDMFDSVYLIKEANWQINIIEKDPLIIGILDDEAYLVSHFDCTPFEFYAKAEF